jgi:hypothetical protein
MKNTGPPSHKPKRKNYGRWVVGFLVLWPVLYVAERQVLKALDQNIRQDRQIFMDYVARLPEPLAVDGASLIHFGSCETHPVGGIWSYKICLIKLCNPSECDASKAFMVRYWRPTPYTFPFFNSYYLNETAFGTSMILLGENKKSVTHLICWMKTSGGLCRPIRSALKEERGIGTAPVGQT